MTTQGERGRESPARWGKGAVEADSLLSPVFTLSVPEPPVLPVLVAVPHAGRAYSAELLARMRHPDTASLRLEDRYVDLLGHEVARETGAGLLVAHAPRALIDLNRPPEDMDWEMVVGGAPANTPQLGAGSRARNGLGLIPRRLHGLGELWQRQMARDEVESRLINVHRPYHEALAEALDRLRNFWGVALLIDLHSMPPLGRKSGPHAAPDFVVGDRFGASCATHLSAVTLHHFADYGRVVAHNRPYAGGYVLDRHGAPSRNIHAMQIEVCRTTYLDEGLAHPGAGLPEMAEILAALIRRLSDELLAGRALAQAAE